MLPRKLILILALISIRPLSAQIQNPDRIDPRWKTDTSFRSVELSELKALLKRDAFPVFNNSKFINKAKADSIYFEMEPVIAVEIDGKAKAYPLNVLTFHEIANDVLAETPILVTYCPLCNSAIVFDRRVIYRGDDLVLEFGVSGMLRKSDMIMWDLETESWWQQFTGEAIVGSMTEKLLDIIPSRVVSVRDFFEMYPKGKILSKSNQESTDYLETYGKNPYEQYDDPSRTSFRHWEEIDTRLPPTERVIHVDVEGFYKLYPWSELEKKGVINDVFHDEHFAIFYKEGVVSVLDETEIKNSKDVGTAVVYSPWVGGKIVTFKKQGDNYIDRQTGSIWDFSGKCIKGRLQGRELDLVPHGQHFAFAWLSFFPDSEIYSE